MANNLYSHITLLLVEDNAVNRMIGTALLQKWGFKVLHAENGEEAVKKVIAEKVDVVLMDIHMPYMDGMEATEAIRNMENPEKKNLPIIALTASSLESDTESYLAGGMDSCVIKPFKDTVLIGAIKEALNKRGVEI
ncbi:MAG: response regulator [Chitinophagaceae bacterium]